MTNDRCQITDDRWHELVSCGLTLKLASIIFRKNLKEQRYKEQYLPLETLKQFVCLVRLFQLHGN